MVFVIWFLNCIVWWLDFALPAYAIFEFALAQFFIREEQTALAQILSEMDTHCSYVKHYEQDAISNNSTQQQLMQRSASHSRMLSEVDS
jgi:hypothetical protein